jgi:hypothetical protein
MTMTDDSPKVIKLVRQLDAVRRDLVTEQKRSGALKMQNERLRKAVVALRQQQEGRASVVS